MNATTVVQHLPRGGYERVRRPLPNFAIEETPAHLTPSSHSITPGSSHLTHVTLDAVYKTLI